MHSFSTEQNHKHLLEFLLQSAKYLSFPQIFSLNSLNSMTKFSVITLKGLEPATSCVRDQDATTAPARHMCETGSLNWPQFKLQWFIRFPEFAEFSEFLFHLGKTPLSTICDHLIMDTSGFRLKNYHLQVIVIKKHRNTNNVKNWYSRTLLNFMEIFLLLICKIFHKS